MAVVAFPGTRRVPIADPADFTGIEALVSAVAGLATATGGAAALGGREMFALSVFDRAMILAQMVEAGEVLFGWREPEAGLVSNVALEKIEVTRGEAAEPAWRALLHVETPEGQALQGALVEPTLDDAARRLTAAAGGMPDALHPTPQAALAAFAAR